MPASRQRASRSAPTKPCVMPATAARSTSSASGMPRLWISRISCRPCWSGMGMEISRSKRPGRRRAGSRALGKLVAASTITCCRCESPSIRASNWATTRFSTSPTTRSRRGAMASISSRKMMLGALMGRLVEELPQVGFALAVELVDDLRPVDGEEAGLRLVGDGAGQQGLAAARRTVEQHALGRVDPQAIEDFRVFQRQLDDLADAVQLPLQAADVLVGERRAGRRRPGPRRPAPSRACRRRRPRAPAGRVVFTRKSARRLPNIVARTRSPAVAGKPSSRLPTYFRSRVEGRRPGRPAAALPPADRGDGADHGEFVEPDAGVLAHHAVDLQMLFAAVLLEGRQHAADGPPLALDLDHVAHVHAQPLHVGRIDPGDAAADVLAGRFADPQGDFRRHGG